MNTIAPPHSHNFPATSPLSQQHAENYVVSIYASSLGQPYSCYLVAAKLALTPTSLIVALPYLGKVAKAFPLAPNGYEMAANNWPGLYPPTLTCEG